jgi:hypothetical protein
MAGVAAMLHYANEFEDGSEEWLDTDTIASDGWHPSASTAGSEST